MTRAAGAGAAGAAGGAAHSRSTIADVLLKESWVAGSFFGCETVTDSIFGYE